VQNRCRTLGTTVHAAVCAAFLRAITDLESSSTVRLVEIPINLRGRLSQPLDEVWGNYFGLVKVAIDCKKAHDLWDLARAFKEQLTKESQGEALFLPWRLTKCLAPVPNAALGKMLRQLLLPQKIEQDLTLSNFGHIDIPVSYGPLKLEAIPVLSQSLAAPNHRILTILTFQGRLSFSLTTFDLPLGLQLKQRAMHHLTETLL
jgi:hypothetical protein